MNQKVVGARELKIRLGSYLREVRAGATFVVTDRGTPIARLVPIATASGSEEAQLAQMQSLGFLTRDSAAGLGPAAPVTASGRSTTEILREERDA